MIVSRVSPFSGETNTMDLPITVEQYERWLDGELAQHVFWDLTADQREFIMTGITPQEWEKIVGDF